jgi:hypothetical protein
VSDAPLGTPIDIELTVENNTALSAGQPGRRICSTKLQLFTGVIVNTGTTTVNFQLETPKGVSNKFQAPPGGFIKLTNCAVFSVLTDAAAIISLVGYVQTYATQADYLTAITKSDVNTTGLFAITVTSAARPAYYDRNPKDVLNYQEEGAIAPHSATVRWTYTVPTARKAMLQLIEVYLYRDTVATTLGYSDVWINMTPSGGSTYILVDAQLFVNTIGAAGPSPVSSGIILLPGDAVSGVDFDSSTAGTMSFYEGMEACEFDA